MRHSEQREANITALADRDLTLAVDIALFHVTLSRRGVSWADVVKAADIGSGLVKSLMSVDPKVSPERLRHGLETLDLALSTSYPFKTSQSGSVTKLLVYPRDASGRGTQTETDQEGSPCESSVSRSSF